LRRFDGTKHRQENDSFVICLGFQRTYLV
jgi:hypothetical protein